MSKETSSLTLRKQIFDIVYPNQNFETFSHTKNYQASKVFKKYITSDLIKLIEKKVPFLNNKNSLNEKLYCFLNNFKEIPQCLICKNKVNFNSADRLKEGYSLTCCKKCRNQLKKNKSPFKTKITIDFILTKDYIKKNFLTKNNGINIQKYNIIIPNEYNWCNTILEYIYCVISGIEKKLKKLVVYLVLKKLLNVEIKLNKLI